MLEKINQNPDLWVNSEKLFKKHPAEKQDWVNSFHQASTLMRYPYSIQMSFRRNLRAPIGTFTHIPLVIIRTDIAFAETSMNFRGFVLAHEIAHIQEANSLLSSIESVFELLPFIGNRIASGGEVRANLGVYNRLRRFTEEKQARKMSEQVALEWCELSHDSSETKVREYMQKYFPFIR